MTISEKTQQLTGCIFALKRYSIHDGPGIRTTVFMKGCPLQCRWCHNPEGIPAERMIFLWEDRCMGCGDCQEACPADAIYRRGGIFQTDAGRCMLHGACVDICPAGAREMIGEEVTVSGLLSRILSDRLFFDQSGGGVTFSGGEPLMQPAFLEAVAKACAEEGLHVALDTSGHAEPEAIQAVLPYVDLFLFDLKLMDPQVHEAYTGQSNALILNNFKWLAESGKEIILRIPVIPGVTDRTENMTAIAGFARDLGSIEQVDLLPYHGMSVEKYRRMKIDSHFEPDIKNGETPLKTLISLFTDEGFRVTTGG